MPMSNWTRLADEWLASRTKVAKQLEVTILPFTDSVRELPPTAETFIVNGTSPDQLPRVRKFFFFFYFHIILSILCQINVKIICCSGKYRINVAFFFFS